MSQCKFITGFLLIFLFYSCHQSDIPDKYFPGVVIIKANSDYQNGLIQALDVFAKEEGIEASSRAIFYEFNRAESPLDLRDTVIFKIKECKNLNVLMAVDIRKLQHCNLDTFKDPTLASQFASFEQIYAMKSSYLINLHLADNHREGPKHRKRHLIPPKVLVPEYIFNDLNYKKVETWDPEKFERDTVIIYDPNDVVMGLERAYFLSPRELTTPPPYPYDTLEIFNISETHDHIIE